eukprot:354255-Chlamydomonas_euryale.AAC.9
MLHPLSSCDSWAGRRGMPAAAATSMLHPPSSCGGWAGWQGAPASPPRQSRTTPHVASCCCAARATPQSCTA